MEEKKITVALNETTHKRMSAVAKVLDISLSDILQDACQQYLRRMRKPIAEATKEFSKRATGQGATI